MNKKETRSCQGPVPAGPIPERSAQGAYPSVDLPGQRHQVAGPDRFFDQFVVLLRNSVSQMVYKHAISTVVPARNVRLPMGDDELPPEEAPAAT